MIEKINQKIEKHELKTRGGETVTQKIEGGLVRADRGFHPWWPSGTARGVPHVPASRQRENTPVTWQQPGAEC